MTSLYQKETDRLVFPHKLNHYWQQPVIDSNKWKHSTRKQTILPFCANNLLSHQSKYLKSGWVGGPKGLWVWAANPCWQCSGEYSRGSTDRKGFRCFRQQWLPDTTKPQTAKSDTVRLLFFTPSEIYRNYRNYIETLNAGKKNTVSWMYIKNQLRILSL